jgi:hypothetical protein
MRFWRKQWLLSLLAVSSLAMVCWRVPAALTERALWLRLRAGDPSAAELYEVHFWLEVLWIVVGMAGVIGGLLCAGKSWHRR